MYVCVYTHLFHGLLLLLVLLQKLHLTKKNTGHKQRSTPIVFDIGQSFVLRPSHHHLRMIAVEMCY